VTQTWLPTGPAPVRGTVVVLPGRGEHGGVYERFGRRLAFDAYAVHALDVSVDDALETVRDLVASLAHEAVGPLVLAGSDTGALHALRVALDGSVTVGGLVLSGLPSVDIDAGGIGWEQELEIRTACPTHRARLTDDAGFERGALSSPVPSSLVSVLADSALDSLGDVPVLVLHGADDPIAPVSGAVSLAARLPGAELAVARTSSHDVLNDAIHRTVAAHVVQWLERLREGKPGESLLDVRPVAEPAGAA
jgi:pimeloyl-ACP methyl ester carboxylesterase